MTTAQPYRSPLPAPARWTRHEEKSRSTYVLRKLHWQMDRGLETAVEHLGGAGGAPLRSWWDLVLFLLAPALDVAALLFIVLYMALMTAYVVLLDVRSLYRAAVALWRWSRDMSMALWSH